jgi:two-component system, sensor histidine kinase and response regulator
MKEKKKANSMDGMFQKELDTIAHIQAIQELEDISNHDLMEEFHDLGKRYSKLLREMKKITRIGDVNYKKLVDANDQIGKQNIKLEELNSQLMEAKATQDKLYSIIAHDLRNPLQFLLFSSEVLYSDYDNMEEETVHSYIGKVFKTVQNMSDLLENLLQWSMSQYGTLECRPRPILYNFLVEDMADFFAEAVEKKNIQLSVQIPENTRINADEEMVKSVLRNLISNSLKFTHSGGNVTISAEEVGDTIITSVSDTGIGIPKEKLETLFKMGLNQSTTGTAKEKGTGLGLTLCKELMEKNGGDIFVESELGVGSRFRISLPKI